MVKLRFVRRLTAIIANLSLFLNSFLPFILVVKPVYAQSPEIVVSTIEYDSSNNKLDITANSSEKIAYQLFYKTAEKIDAVAGNDLNQANQNESFYLGTCSSNSVCLPQNITRGILKTETNSKFYSIFFTFENNTLIIDKEIESSQSDLTQEEDNFLNNINSQILGDITPVWTFEKVELNKTYTAPQNNQVKITFTKLPEIPGNIKIEEITLTKEQIEQTGALSDKAYDITSDMTDGTFSYNLSLPIPESSKDKTIEIKFVEDISQIDSAQTVTNTVGTETTVSATNLDHFTIFIVVKITDKNLVEKEIFKKGETVYINTLIFDLTKTKIRVKDPNDNIKKTYNETLSPVNQYKYITELSDGIGEYSIDVASYKRLGFLNWKWVWENNVDRFTLIEGVCGDSIIDFNEQCDDGNLSNADGCSNTCIIENGWECNGNPSLCKDITPPSKPKFTSPTINITNINMITLKWEDGDDVESGVNGYVFRYVFNPISGGNPINWSSGFVQTTSKTRSGSFGHGQGTYAMYIKVIDSAGNESIESEPFIITYDATKPLVQITKPTNNSIISGNIDIKGTITEINPHHYWLAIYRQSDNSSIFSTIVNHNHQISNQSLYNWDTTTQVDGIYQIKLAERDAADNRSADYTVDVIVDNTAPNITVNPYVTNDKTPILTGTVNDNSAVISVEINGITYPATNNNNGTWTLADNTITPNLSDNTYDVTATATDIAGNVGIDSTTNELTIDTVAPMATFQHYIDGNLFTGPIAYTNKLNKLTFTAQYTDNSPSSGLLKDSYVIFGAQSDHSFKFSQNGAKSYCSWRKEPNLVDGLSGNSFSLTNPENFSNCVNSLADGEYYMAHQVYDNAIRQDIPSINQFRDVLGLHFIIDTIAPTSTIDGGANNDTVYSSSWNGSISGTAFDNISGITGVKVSIQRAVDGKYWGNTDWVDSETLVDANGNENWSYTMSSSPSEGSYTIKSHAIDGAGNQENTYTLTIILDKTISEVGISLNQTNPDASNGWYKTQPEITLTHTDVNFDKIQYQWDSQSHSGWNTYLNPFKLDVEGAHILYYRAIDKATNISQVGIKNIKWDKTELEYGPQNISAYPNPTSGSTSKITWEKAKDNDGIDHYEIQWSLNDSTNSLSYSKTVDSNTFETEIDKLIEGRWTVKVIAFDASGKSKDGSIDLIVDRTGPSAPTLTLTSTGTGTASLSWNSINDAKDYIIWYGSTSGTYLYGARVGNVNSYTVQGLGAGNYYFVVKAVDNAQNQSGNSNEVNTGTIVGAVGIQPGEPAEGFTPEVLGTDTNTDANNPEVNPTPTGEVLGVSQNKDGFNWWWLLLLLIPTFFIGRSLYKKNN